MKKYKVQFKESTETIEKSKSIVIFANTLNEALQKMKDKIDWRNSCKEYRDYEILSITLLSPNSYHET